MFSIIFSKNNVDLVLQYYAILQNIECSRMFENFLENAGAEKFLEIPESNKSLSGLSFKCVGVDR